MVDEIQEDSYDLASFYFGEQQVVMSGFKISYKIKATRKYSTDQYHAYGVGFSDEEVSWEADEVDDTYNVLVKNKADRQKLKNSDDYIATYNLDPAGNLIERDVLKRPWIENWDDEDGGKKFGVKGGALYRKSSI